MLKKDNKLNLVEATKLALEGKLTEETTKVEESSPNNFKVSFTGTATVMQGNEDAARETLKKLILGIESSNIIDITVAVGEAKTEE